MGTNAALLIHTVNERSTTAETWIYEAGNQTVSKKQLLPEISINEFYSEGNKLTDPETYKGNVTTELRDDGVIVYDVYAWMEVSLSKKQKAFAVSAIWDGKGFKVRKTKL